MNGPSGSYWSQEYFLSTGTVMSNNYFERIETRSADRLLTCRHCGATYFFNPMTEQALVRLACEACGSGLEFK
jgi:hypothetical protein